MDAPVLCVYVLGGGEHCLVDRSNDDDVDDACIHALYVVRPAPTLPLLIASSSTDRIRQQGPAYT